MPAVHAGQPDRTGGHGRRGEIGGRHDAVGDDGVLACAELFHPLDADGTFARAENPRSAPIEVIGQVGDFRLARRVGDDRGALGKHRSRMTFSVAPTLGKESTTFAPLKPPSTRQSR